MKFSINYGDKKENRLLTYEVGECSFNIKPRASEAIVVDLALNALELNVADNKKIIEVLGFLRGARIQSNYDVPKYKEGSLKVIDDLETGVGSYRVTKEDLPIYINTQTGWLCIGDPEQKGNAVEFINHCVAVIDNNKEFVSLWLKPQLLPEI
jgi:hypothetical protein